MRCVLALWLVLFSVQSSDLIAALAPDGCTEEATGSADSCADACARCICCARASVFIPSAPVDPAAVTIVRIAAPSRIESPTDDVPRGILHVPR